MIKLIKALLKPVTETCHFGDGLLRKILSLGSASLDEEYVESEQFMVFKLDPKKK